MELNQLIDIMRRAGVVGAGGAGFPSYAKLNTAAETVILNCAECEPLLKLHRQVLAKYAHEITETLEMIAETLQAREVIIAVKKAYTEAVEAVKAELPHCPRTRIGYLSEVYPAGDEVITIYETTGKVVAPGALPITVGCLVYNVETVYNVWRAWKENTPVIHKYITVAGEVQNPCTLKAPIGITYGELINLAGGTTCSDIVILSGGPMMGKLSSPADIVTKTSNAILVLPKNSYLIQKRMTPINISVQRTAAACCQCRMCTDLCPRNLLGYPIESHKIMRAVASGTITETQAFIDSFSCSSCGLCELYACGQGLNPRSIIAEVKGEVQKGGVKPAKSSKPKDVNPIRSYRRVSVSRLTSRLGLAKYDTPAPLVDVNIPAKRVKIKLGQSIGASAVASVSVGDHVEIGTPVGMEIAEKLGTPVHASVTGRVAEVTNTYVLIEQD